jgi:16S rRNA (cytosine1402-N4)-methyltransferase
MESSIEQSDQGKPPHLPVLYHEIIHALKPHQGGSYVDATVGAGGHAYGILEQSNPDGRLLGMDVDPLAIEIAHKSLELFGDRAILVCDTYTNLAHQMGSIGWKRADGILLDLGVSSMQLDRPEKGFTFTEEGPLDMRFSPRTTANAAFLVNTLSEKDLADLIWRYGEDPFSRRIAHAICLARPLKTTVQLAAVIKKAVRSHPGRIHPATRTFQALRIAVNTEMENIERVLPIALEALSAKGRLSVITFHSLEDRIVKHFIQRESKDCICPPRQPFCTCDHHATLIDVTKHPITPKDEEVRSNPRARSAKLRIAEKL